MGTTITVMWVLLAGGGVYTQEHPTFDSCHAAQQVLLKWAEAVGDRRFDAILCIEQSLVPAR